MQIRDASEADIEDICRLFISEQELFWIFPKGRYPFTPDQLAELYAVRRDLTVATHEDEVVGFANLYDFKPGSHVFIGNVVVAREYRGRGLGRTLVAHMLCLIRNKYSLPQVRISVFSDNTRALLLYSSIGFSPYTIEERRDFSGKRVALVHMKLEEPVHKTPEDG
jgi:ribosomal protein S18 acetylase RimI-like enzyme